MESNIVKTAKVKISTLRNDILQYHQLLEFEAPWLFTAIIATWSVPIENFMRLLVLIFCMIIFAFETMFKNRNGKRFPSKLKKLEELIQSIPEDDKDKLSLQEEVLELNNLFLIRKSLLRMPIFYICGVTLMVASWDLLGNYQLFNI